MGAEAGRPNAWRDAEPALTDIIRLLLLFSRVKLDEEQCDRARELCSKVEDWSEFGAKAAEHFIAPLCLYHLSHLGEGDFIEAARRALLRHARPMAMQTLRLAAMQRQFIADHVLPMGAPFSVIKGRALAARYYPDASLRFARDLDVLVPVERIAELVVSAQRNGYRVYPALRELSLDESHMLARQSRVVTLVGADRILIEVHAQLDKAGFLLDHRAMLKRVETIPIDGLETGVLPTSDHFVYICLHHTKHFWSRLNWLADLDALIQAPDFDQDAVMALARQRGVEKTVAACLGFHHVCASRKPWEDAQSIPEVMDLLRACLLILAEGVSQEFQMRPDRLSVDFNFPWQLPKGFERRQKWRSQLARLHPSLADYHAFPLPHSWHWLYFAIRPVLVMLRRQSRASSRH